MKWMKRKQVYQASNVTFNPATRRAYSYDWWMFTDVINGKLVFNEYRYSNTTSKHQSKVRLHLASRGIKVDLYIDSRLSLGAVDVGRDAVENQMCKIVDLIIRQSKGRLDYTLDIQGAKEKLNLIGKVFKIKIDDEQFSSMLARAIEQEEKRLCVLWLESQIRREEKALRAAAQCPVVNLVRQEFANATQN